MPAYRDEKLKTWYAKFRYKDWQGTSRYTTKRGFKTKREALEYEHDFKSTSKDKVDVTIAYIIDKYFEDAELRLKASTFKTNKQVIAKHILPYLGDIKVSDITPVVVRQWQNQIIKLQLSPNTTRKIHTRCSTIFNYAIKYYGLKQNPLHITGNIGKIESSVNFWEISEFNQFISVVDNNIYKLCFKLLFYSGMRLGELLALNVDDFNFDTNEITISKSKSDNSGEITTTKTPYSIRTIEMPVSLMEEVRSYISGLDKSTSPIFHISRSSLQKVIHKYAMEAGVKEIRVHDLRHSHASLLINGGFPITTISKRLGHKSPKITLEIYSHMYAETSGKVADFLQDILLVKRRSAFNDVTVLEG